MDYIATIGLEVHVQLRTAAKLFCRCPNRYGDAPNQNTCPICLGYPGVLPVPNREAIRLTVRTGLMLGATIAPYSKFDRKSYFYPDMPKNYQISQYDMPLCEGGALLIDLPQGGAKRVGIIRVHLEEDVAKSTHFEQTSGVDFNRAGTPLMEIVTHPDISSPEEAHAFLSALKQILTYGGVSDCNMEQGNIRCDSNISVRPAGQAEFGTKTEIKNMNTFSGVQRALAYEIERQVEVLRAGGAIFQETRRWDDPTGATAVMRGKEYAHDYRYFPDPDLMPMELGPEEIDRERAALPELPRARQARLIERYGLSPYDAGVLVSDPELSAYFEAAAASPADPKLVANFVINDLLRELAAAGLPPRQNPVRADQIRELVQLMASGTISSKIAKEVFVAVFQTGRDPGAIVAERGLVQVQDAEAVRRWVRQAIVENAAAAEDVRNGKERALARLVGAVMKESRGKANPQLVNALLREELACGGAGQG